MRFNQDDGRQSWERLTLAGALSTAGGAINAIGLMIVGAVISHTTGDLAELGRGLRQDSRVGLLPVACLAAFGVGVVASALLFFRLRARGLQPASGMLLLEGALLFALARSWIANPLVVAGTLCFAMGWQNAIARMLLGSRNRPTDVTASTSELAELAELALATNRNHAWLRANDVGPSRRRALHHGVVVLGFLLGVVAGAALTLRTGHNALLFPGALLLLLSAIDLIQRARHAWTSLQPRR